MKERRPRSSRFSASAVASLGRSRPGAMWPGRWPHESSTWCIEQPGDLVPAGVAGHDRPDGQDPAAAAGLGHDLDAPELSVAHVQQPAQLGVHPRRSQQKHAALRTVCRRHAPGHPDLRLGRGGRLAVLCRGEPGWLFRPGGRSGQRPRRVPVGAVERGRGLGRQVPGQQHSGARRPVVPVREALSIAQRQLLQALLGRVGGRQLRMPGVKGCADAVEQAPGSVAVAAQPELVDDHPPFPVKAGLIDARQRIGQPGGLAGQRVGRREGGDHDEVHGLGGEGHPLPVGPGGRHPRAPVAAVGLAPAMRQVLDQVGQPLLPRWILGHPRADGGHDRHRRGRSIQLPSQSSGRPPCAGRSRGTAATGRPQAAGSRPAAAPAPAGADRGQPIAASSADSARSTMSSLAVSDRRK